MAVNSVLVHSAVVVKYKVGVDAKGNEILALPTFGAKSKELMI
jgi:hypothetical protein